MDPLRAREERKLAQKKLAHQAFVLFKIHKDVYPNLVAFILGASDINAHAVREVLVQRFKPRPTPAQEAALSGKIDTMAITAYLQRNCDTWLVGRRPAAIEWLAEKSLLIANSKYFYKVSRERRILGTGTDVPWPWPPAPPIAIVLVVDREKFQEAFPQPLVNRVDHQMKLEELEELQMRALSPPPPSPEDEPANDPKDQSELLQAILSDIRTEDLPRVVDLFNTLRI